MTSGLKKHLTLSSYYPENKTQHIVLKRKYLKQSFLNKDKTIINHHDIYSCKKKH